MYVEEPEVDPLAQEEETVKLYNTPFEDVPSDSGYAEAIAYLSENGIMNGTDAALFSPNVYINYIDAVTVLVRMLGYKEMAEASGGYPNGYIKMATKEKIVSASADINGYLGRDDMALLLENVIKAKYLDPEVFTSDGYVNYIRKEGILGLTRGIYAGTGKVTVNPLTMLSLPGSKLKFNQVKIGDIEYNIGTTDALALIGAEVDYWYTEDGGIRTLCAVVPTDTTEITVLSSMTDEITSISNSKIVYTKNGEEEEEELEITNSTFVIYNGVAIDKEIEEVVDNENDFKGFINIVENYDKTITIIIEEYIDLTVESIDYSKSEIIAVKGDADEDNIVVDASTNNNFVAITDQAGKELKIGALKAGDIITVYQSKNDGKRLVRVFVSNGSIDGTIDKIDAEGNTYIDGKKYNFSNRYEGPKNIGVQRRFYLNYYGDVYSSEALDEIPQVGLYFGKAFQTDGITDTAEIKIMTSASKAEIYKLAKKVKIDGEKIEGITAIINGNGTTWAGLENLDLETPIRYRLNSKGEVSMIDTPGTKTEDPDNTLIKIPGSYSKLGYVKSMACLLGKEEPYPILFHCPSTAVAFAFIAPEDAPFEQREKYCVSGKIDNVISGAWDLTGGVYSTTGNERVADIVMDSTKNTDSESTPPIVVQEVTTKLDKNGELINILKGDCSNGINEYILTDDFVNSIYSNSAGTVVVPVKDIIESLIMGDVISFRVLDKNTPIQFTGFKFYGDAATKREFTSVSGETINWSPTIYPGKNTSGGGNEYGDASYKYGTITEKTPDYFLIDSAGSVEELITLSGLTVTEIYTRDDGVQFFNSGLNTSTLKEGDKVLLYFRYSKVVNLVVYRGI